MYDNLNKDGFEVKNRLVNNVILISVIVGLPLLMFTLLRAVTFNDQPIFFRVLFYETIIYSIVLVLYSFRNRIKYFLRAWFIIGLVFMLAVLDFWQVGFMSLGFIWLTAAAILSVLFFNFKQGIYSIVLGLLIIALFSFLEYIGIIKHDINYNELAQLPVNVIVRTLMSLIISLIVIYSIRSILNALNKVNDQLRSQTVDLLDSTMRLEQEVVIRRKSEQQALENEYKFKNIFEISSDPIAIIGMNGNFLDFNQAFLNLIDVQAFEISNKDFIDYVPEDIKSDYKKYHNNLINAPARFEIKYKNKIGSIIFLDVSSTLIDYSGEKAILTIFRDNTAKINHERTVFTVALEAEEKERLRLSKELHDGLGPLLSALKIYFEVLEKRPGDAEIQRRINSTLTESIKSVKEISNNLSPYVLQNLGIIKAIRSFIEKIAFNKELKIELESNLDQRLAENIEISIYRLITELLNNTIKHANARNVIIKLSIDNSMLNIHYGDDGVGFDKLEIDEKSSGIGLFNIRSRIEKMGGLVQINTSQGKGFKLNAQINIEENYYGNSGN